MNQANVVFSNPIDIMEFVSVIFGKDVGYKNVVLERFIDLIFKNRPDNTRAVCMNYAIYILLAFVILKVVVDYFSKENGNVIQNKIVNIVTDITVVIFIIGLLLSYMYKFSEYEALNLASSYRYISTVLIAVVCECLFVLAMIETNKSGNKGMYFFLAAGVLFSIYNNDKYHELIAREYAEKTAYEGAAFANVEKTLKQLGETDAKVRTISSYGADFIQYRMKYEIYPNNASLESPFSITTDEENTYDSTQKLATGNYMPEQLISDYIKYEYDYMAMVTLHETFAEEYGSVFENPQEIYTGAVFALNIETGKFYLVS